ncbi:MAG: hypothetical protein NVS3B8_00470 [Chitinophagaceae bacterium]
MLAVFILIIALLNYINLSTAKSMERSREVGIRKVSGVMPFQLIRPCLFESFLLVAITWIFAVGLVVFSLPFFNDKRFYQMVLVALAITLPITGMVMNKWLASYAYHIE